MNAEQDFGRQTEQKEAGNQELHDKVNTSQRAEEARHRQEAVLQNIIAHIPCAVFWKDRNSVYLGCNGNAARSMGKATPQEVIGQTDYDMPFTREEADFYVRCDRQVMETGQPLFDIEETMLRPDGRRAVLRTSKVPLRDEHGEIIGVLGIYADITERKRAEESLREAEEQLREAQKMEAVGRLAGGIAHDFNNLLTIITGYSEMLLGNLVPSDPRREFVEQIKVAGDRAAVLTRQLLAFGRKQILQLRVVDLNALIRDLERMLRHLLGPGIELMYQPWPNPVPLEADPSQIEQVLVNLSSNARDAMPTGGRLTIATALVNLEANAVRSRPEMIPGDYVLLTVSDTGCGMSAATRERIFEPFFTTKELGRGTGLGLSTVYGIVKQSGGHIAVESEPGRGALFRIYLPALQSRT